MVDTLEFHPIANIFPLMFGDEYRELVEDIYQNGLLESIWLYEGKILDGRNRYMACRSAGIEPKFRQWAGEGSSPTAFVVAKNIHRRHLDSSQRAACAVAALPFLEGEAKKRQDEARRQARNILDHNDGGNNSTTIMVKSRDEAAQMFGTNGRYVQDAKTLAEKEPELFERVRTGEITIPQAKQEAFNYKRDSRTTKPQDIYEPKGYDTCQTPAYALDPLLPYLSEDWTIWEPAAGENYLVEALYDSGYNEDQVVVSDILTGQNFFEFVPMNWDCLVTNPPYSIKYEWLKRCYELGKPFALLVPVEILGTKTAQLLFEEYGLEIMLLDQRVNFKMPNKGWDSSAQFPTFWLCWQLLPRQIIFGKVEKHVHRPSAV